MTDAANVELKLEVLILPVADVDRSKRFYAALGWREDADFAFPNGFRVVQFTPPGSACSIQFGTRITSAAPGTTHDIYLVATDVDATREALGRRGVEVGHVFHPIEPGAQFEPNQASGRAPGPEPGHASYRSFLTFGDPDGNTFLVQEVTARLPGRSLGSPDVATTAALLREAETRHGVYAQGGPEHHWSDWYSAYLVARQRGKAPENAALAAGQHMTQVLADRN